MTTSTSVSLVKPDVLASGRVLTSMTIPKMDRYYCVVSPNFCSFNDRYELIRQKTYLYEFIEEVDIYLTLCY